MTTSAIKLTSPHELLAIVPYLLGFNPTNSIVTMCLSDNKLGLTQRLDLPRPEDADDVGSALLPSLSNENPDAVIVIGYEDNKGESLPALEALTKALHSHALPIHDRIVVRDGRWRSLDCHNPTEGLHFHDLRHYYASLLIRHGGVGQDGSSKARARKRSRDSGHLQPPVA